MPFTSYRVEHFYRSLSLILLPAAEVLGRGYLRVFMSFGEAFLQVSALTMTMSMPLELSIRKRPSAVKSMPITAPDTFV